MDEMPDMDLDGMARLNSLKTSILEENFFNADESTTLLPMDGNMLHLQSYVYIKARDVGGNAVQAAVLCRDFTLSEDSDTLGSHPFRVTISKDDAGVSFANIVTGIIFMSDLTLSESDIIRLPIQSSASPWKKTVSGSDYIWIEQTVDSNGNSTFTLEVGSLGASSDLITTSADGYYASSTKHLIAKIISDPPTSLIVEQYITTNLVRAISTHSGVAYYRLLPR